MPSHLQEKLRTGTLKEKKEAALRMASSARPEERRELESMFEANGPYENCSCTDQWIAALALTSTGHHTVLFYLADKWVYIEKVIREGPWYDDQQTPIFHVTYEFECPHIRGELGEVLHTTWEGPIKAKSFLDLSSNVIGHEYTDIRRRAVSMINGLMTTDHLKEPNRPGEKQYPLLFDLLNRLSKKGEKGFSRFWTKVKGMITERDLLSEMDLAKLLIAKLQNGHLLVDREYDFVFSLLQRVYKEGKKKWIKNLNSFEDQLVAANELALLGGDHAMTYLRDSLEFSEDIERIGPYYYNRNQVRWQDSPMFFGESRVTFHKLGGSLAHVMDIHREDFGGSEGLRNDLYKLIGISVSEDQKNAIEIIHASLVAMIRNLPLSGYFGGYLPPELGKMYDKVIEQSAKS